jgi:hypothetical protein
VIALPRLESEAWTLSQDAGGVVQVLPPTVERSPSPHLASGLFDQRLAPQFASNVALRGAGLFAAIDAIPDGHGAVSENLRVEIRITPPSGNQIRILPPSDARMQ